MYSTSNGAYGSWNQHAFNGSPNHHINTNQIVNQYQLPINTYNYQPQHSHSFQPPSSYSQPAYSYPSSSSSPYSKPQNPQYLGLTNLGNTCYMSSILQALFDILRLQPSSRSPITYLYTQLQQSHSTKDYTEFKKYLGTKLDFVSGYQQQDAHQFLTNLLQILNRQNQGHQESFRKPNFQIDKNKSVVSNWNIFCDEMRKSDNSQIIDIFGGELYTELRCPENHSQYLFQRFLSISIPIPTSSPQVFHLQRLLIDNFKQETLDGISCTSCKHKTRKNKKSVIYNPPKVLVIHLKRFEQGFWSNSKINAPVAYNEGLDLKQEYIHPDTATLGERYELYAVVHHIGTMNGGHYMVEKKVGGEWLAYNDMQVGRTKVKEVDNVSETAYILFYRRR